MRLGAALLCGLLLACAAPTGETTTSATAAATSVSPSSSVTTSTSTTSAATDADAPRAIPVGRATILEPGVWTTDRFAVPLRFAVMEDGWRSLTVLDRFVELGFRLEGSTTLGLRVGILVAVTAEDAVGAIESFGERQRVEVVDGPVTAAVGGHPAVSLDVRVGESPAGGCIFGVPMVSLGGFEWGIDDCTEARVWAVDIEDHDAVVMIVANVDDDANWDAVMPAANRLVEASEFG